MWTFTIYIYYTLYIYNIFDIHYILYKQIRSNKQIFLFFIGMERFKYSENIESNKLSLLVFWRHSLAVNLLKRYVVWALSIPSYLSSPMYPRITSWDAENVVLFVFCLHLPQCYIKGATQRIYTIFFQTIGIIKELFCLFFSQKITDSKYKYFFEPTKWK